MSKSNQGNPPKWADRLLEFYCASHLLEDLQGDLHERFHDRVSTHGVASARCRFVIDTISFVRPYILRRKKSNAKSSTIMIRHYLKTGFRNVQRDKRYLVVNALGLALGIGCSLVLIGYIFSELSFDHTNQYADRTYRISLTTIIDTQETAFAPIPPAFGLALKASIPEIEKVARIMSWSGDGSPSAISLEGKLFNESNLMNADSTIFDVMDYKFIMGDRTALQQRDRIVISNSLATKLFGPDYRNNKKLIHTTIKVDKKDLAIAGVIEDVLYTSHFRPAALIAWEGYGNDNVWNDSHAFTYMRLVPRAVPATIQTKLDRFTATNENIKKVSEEFGAKVKIYFQPLTTIHMHSNKVYELQQPGNIEYLYAFGIVAAFFLVMSSINYVNLSIAASSHRFKEIGVRKVMGALRGQVQKQFIIESFLLIGMAFAGGLLIFYLMIPLFNSIMAYSLTVDLLINKSFVGIGISLLIILALMSGYYPAFYLSLANPIAVFKNRLQLGNKLHFRKTLLIAQFAISSLMIVAVLAVTSQMNFLSKQSLGINKENVVVINLPWPAIESLPALKTDLLQVAGVTKVAATDYLPGISTLIDEHKVERSNGQMETSTVGRMFIDKDYMTLLGLQIIEGRNFDPNSVADYKESFLVNEAAVRAYGWRESAGGPIGRKIDGFNYGKKGTVIGVVKDVNLYSLHNKVQPLIISAGIYMTNVYVKIESPDVASVMQGIEKKYSKVIPDHPFEYQFLDERFERLYEADRKMNRALIGGGAILIFISCIGLFALSAFLVTQRTKEIGVRKVLGASIKQIMILLSREYISLIIVANLVAITASYFLVQKWLSGYAYRVEFSWWLLLVPIATTFLLAFVSISFQVISAAKSNPVNSLRYE